MSIRTKLIKDLMKCAEAYKEGEASSVGTMTDMGLLLDDFIKAEFQKSAIQCVSLSVNIVDSDIAIIEALHDLLHAHGYSLEFTPLKKARELTQKMYKSLYEKDNNI